MFAPQKKNKAKTTRPLDDVNHCEKNPQPIEITKLLRHNAQHLRALRQHFFHLLQTTLSTKATEANEDIFMGRLR